MKTITPSPIFFRDAGALALDPKDQFKARFQRSLRLCVHHGFCMEESFGMIFTETLDEVRLDDEEQAELYEELIRWAKTAELHTGL